MTEKQKETWYIETSGSDMWHCDYEFESKEEAIKYGKENFLEICEEQGSLSMCESKEDYPKMFQVGRKDVFVASIDAGWTLDSISEQAYNEVGECADGYLDNVTKEDEQLLEEMLNETYSKWEEMTNNKPHMYPIVDVEEIELGGKQ